MEKIDPEKARQRIAYMAWKRKYPTLEDKYYAPRKYTGKPSNVLTRKVIDFTRDMGYQAERISSTGQMRDNRRIVTDCVGRQKQIGSVEWVNPTTTRGTSDVSCTILGRSVKVEIKINDKQSSFQKSYQESVEQAGGVYIIVRSFDEYFHWLNHFVVQQKLNQMSHANA